MKNLSLICIAVCCVLCSGCARSEAAEKISVRKWGSSREVYLLQKYEDFSLKLKLSEFPETVFVQAYGVITARENSEEKILICGMPIISAYLTDLNNDGYPEICADVMFGSGICDEHIEVYDYYHDERYVLWDRMKYDYQLAVKENELLVQKTVYGQTEGTPEISRLSLENMKLLQKEDESNVSHPETNADS